MQVGAVAADYCDIRDYGPFTQNHVLFVLPDPGALN